jgi:hypothetical protein
MSRLNTQPNVATPDDIYQQLVQLHDGLSEQDSLTLYARLVLILINHIGDAQVITEAIALAARKPDKG